MLQVRQRTNCHASIPATAVYLRRRKPFFVIFKIKMQENYWHDIIKGICSGIFGGLGVYLSKIIYDEIIFCRDEKRIINFFYQENVGKGYEFRTTEAIASFTNLPEDRVNFVCATSKKITRNSKEKLSWRISTSK